MKPSGTVNGTGFGEREISGTLDGFKGYDGTARGGTVRPLAVPVMGGGDISEDDSAHGKPVKTDSAAWTAGGKAGKPSGSWLVARGSGRRGACPAKTAFRTLSPEASAPNTAGTEK